MKNKVRFCWLCGKKLWGNYCELLVIDGHERTLHMQCANTVKKELDFIKRGKEFHSVEWTPSGSLDD